MHCYSDLQHKETWKFHHSEAHKFQKVKNRNIKSNKKIDAVCSKLKFIMNMVDSGGRINMARSQWTNEKLGQLKQD